MPDKDKCKGNERNYPKHEEKCIWSDFIIKKILEEYKIKKEKAEWKSKENTWWLCCCRKKKQKFKIYRKNRNQ